MRDRLIDGLIQGDRLAWGAVAVLWALTTVVVLVHRPFHGGARAGQPPGAWTWLLFAVATATSLAGLPLSSAIAVPRVRWAAVDAPDLVASGGESWRRLRGPAVVVAGPDVAVPTVDGSGRWVLVGLFSGKPVEGLPAAEPAPMKPGAPRLCLPGGEACRPWPVAWPDPARPMSLGELGWSQADGGGERTRIEGALAYDVETGLYLRRIEPAPGTPLGAPFLELIGRLAGDAPRDPGILFVLRKVAAGRLKAVRVVFAGRASTMGAAPQSPPPQALATGEAPAQPSRDGAGAPAAAQVFSVQRAEVSLTAGPRAFAAVRPLLALTAVSLPLGVLALLLAPFLHRSRWRSSAPGGPRPYRRPEPGEGPTRREASAWIAPYLEAAAVLSAGLAAAGPAVVAIAALWGSR